MSEVRQRQQKDKSPTRPKAAADADAQKKKAAAQKSGGSSFCAVFLGLTLLSLGSAFLYINHTHGETFAQTGERVKTLVTENVAQLQKKIADLQSAQQGTTEQASTSKTISGLPGLVENFGKSFDFSLENGVFTLSSKKCTIPFAVNDEWKAILEVAKKDFSSITGLIFDSYTCSFIGNEGLVFVGEALSSFKNLKHLRMELRGAKNITDAGLQQFSHLLGKNAPGLEILQFNITLHVPQAHQITDDGVEALAASFEGLKNLKHLSLNFAGTRMTDDGAMAVVNSVGKNLQKLVNFGLELKWIGAFTNDFVAQYSKVLTQLKNLEIIHLNLDGCTALTNDALASLGNALAQVSKLREFSFSIYRNTVITVDGFKALFKGLETQALEKLILFFTGSQGFSDETMPFLAELVAKHAKTLKTIAFQAGGNKLFTNKGMKAFASAFTQPFTQLQEVAVEAIQAETVSDEGVLAIMNNLAKSGSTITSLTFKFDKILGHPDFVYAELADLLQKKFNNLKRFELHIAFDSKIPEEGFTRLANILGSDLTQLEHLSLLLASVSGQFESAAAAFGNQLRYGFKSLKSLFLTFYDGKFNNNAIFSFANGLKYQTKLERLGFSMMGGKNFNNEAAKNMTSTIVENLNNLYELQLAFRMSDQITDDTVKHMIATIPKGLKTVKRFNLDLALNAGVTDKSLVRLANVLSQLDNLQLVALHAQARPPRPQQLQMAVDQIFYTIPISETMVA